MMITVLFVCNNDNNNFVLNSKKYIWKNDYQPSNFLFLFVIELFKNYNIFAKLMKKRKDPPKVQGNF